MNLSKEAILVLEDGRTFRGLSFGATGEAFGEIVFNTSMTGYQEILTDPSYAGQIVTMTYPLIGNYGVNEEDVESRRPWVEALVVREASRISSNWRATETLDAYLVRHGIVGIERIDTRGLVRHIRDKGAMRSAISTIEPDREILLERVLESPSMQKRELASVVTTGEVFEVPAEGAELFHIVCFDFGVKTNSLRTFARLGCRITVVPADTKASKVLELRPDGVFLSNGPGDPASMADVAEEIRTLADSRTPLFGICLGHQLLGRSFGAATFKMKFGHRGGNQPIKDLATGKIEITAHNHGFAIDSNGLPGNVRVTHVNVNDDTIAGIMHRSLPVFSVQYHPEAAPGPHDAEHHFKRFIDMMKRERSARTN
ncbi:MAG: glutamine-hydrolyzing carbamoyl-phosphate synthase small subunit [Acidobacteriota bacterium]|nr:glutamine-hydrolyzing carbamoyl-phosphate synthase small subunit [Acidobacteriota bacterium]MDH3530041.1 glutamine-hydrolyzing carbamoyl-phosphate synthase small subunit [Acidobacteriota bacterium]